MSGFDDTFGAYFAKRYGANWREKRQGRPLRDARDKCNCWFCRMTPEQLENWRRQHGGDKR